MEKHHIIPVWFFVGLLLGIYGLLICASGLMEFANPVKTIVLSELHAPVWWGAGMAVVGAAYVIIYRPR
jgi:hypothetical protein